MGIGVLKICAQKTQSSQLAKPAEGVVEAPITMQLMANGGVLYAGEIIPVDEIGGSLQRERDIIVASECATFAVPEVDRGAMGGGAHLQRMFPVQKVRYMYFTGLPIDAQEAYRLGAVERVVPRDELLPAAREIAAAIAEKSPRMIALAKEALTGIEDGNLEDKYRSEQGFTLEAYQSPDSAESRDAFVNKRDAKFTEKK